MAEHKILESTIKKFNESKGEPIENMLGKKTVRRLRAKGIEPKNAHKFNAQHLFDIAGIGIGKAMLIYMKNAGISHDNPEYLYSSFKRIYYNVKDKKKYSKQLAEGKSVPKEKRKIIKYLRKTPQRFRWVDDREKNTIQEIVDDYTFFVDYLEHRPDLKRHIKPVDITINLHDELDAYTGVSGTKRNIFLPSFYTTPYTNDNIFYGVGYHEIGHNIFKSDGTVMNELMNRYPGELRGIAGNVINILEDDRIEYFFVKQKPGLKENFKDFANEVAIMHGDIDSSNDYFTAMLMVRWNKSHYIKNKQLKAKINFWKKMFNSTHRSNYDMDATIKATRKIMEDYIQHFKNRYKGIEKLSKIMPLWAKYLSAKGKTKKALEKKLYKKLIEMRSTLEASIEKAESSYPLDVVNKMIEYIEMTNELDKINDIVMTSEVQAYKQDVEKVINRFIKAYKRTNSISDAGKVIQNDRHSLIRKGQLLIEKFTKEQKTSITREEKRLARGFD